jgi:hypothetical protein
MRAALIALLLMATGAAHGQVNFGGTNRYIKFAAPPTNATGTVTAWITLTSLPINAENRAEIYHIQTASLDQFWHFSVYTNRLLFGRFPRSGTLSAIMTNTWTLGKATFVAISYDSVAQTGLLCIDNTVYSYPLTGAYTGSSIPTFNFIGLLREGVAYYFPGTIEDVRRYTRALSASEIRSIYETPYALADDPALVLRTCVASGDTGATLTGTARNYWGPDGTYSNSPTVPPFKVPFEPPMTEETP